MQTINPAVLLSIKRDPFSISSDYKKVGFLGTMEVLLA
jgi:hypothetical protein